MATTLVQAAAADPETKRLVAELYRVEGKAEIIHGEIVHLPMPGRIPCDVAFAIVVSLKRYVQRTHRGFAASAGNQFLVTLPRRNSFGPDAAYYVGPDPGMKFYQGAPRFAVEVRSENDYGLTAGQAMLDKRQDYFDAGTLVVWDVDPLGTDWVVRVFRDRNAEVPAAVFRRGETADAEPAVPGWTLIVDDLFA